MFRSVKVFKIQCQGVFKHYTVGNDNGDAFPQSGDGVNVTVSYGQQGGYRPPDPGKCIPEYLRLRRMLYGVHDDVRGSAVNSNLGLTRKTNVSIMI